MEAGPSSPKEKKRKRVISSALSTSDLTDPPDDVTPSPRTNKRKKESSDDRHSGLDAMEERDNDDERRIVVTPTVKTEDLAPAEGSPGKAKKKGTGKGKGKNKDIQDDNRVDVDLTIEDLGLNEPAPEEPPETEYRMDGIVNAVYYDGAWAYKIKWHDWTLEQTAHELPISWPSFDLSKAPLRFWKELRRIGKVPALSADELAKLKNLKKRLKKGQKPGKGELSDDELVDLWDQIGRLVEPQKGSVTKLLNGTIWDTPTALNAKWFKEAWNTYKVDREEHQKGILALAALGKTAKTKKVRDLNKRLKLTEVHLEAAREEMEKAVRECELQGLKPLPTSDADNDSEHEQEQQGQTSNAAMPILPVLAPAGVSAYGNPIPVKLSLRERAKMKKRQAAEAAAAMNESLLKGPVPEEAPAPESTNSVPPLKVRLPKRVDSPPTPDEPEATTMPAFEAVVHTSTGMVPNQEETDGTAALPDTPRKKRHAPKYALQAQQPFQASFPSPGESSRPGGSSLRRKRRRQPSSKAADQLEASGPKPAEDLPARDSMESSPDVAPGAEHQSDAQDRAVAAPQTENEDMKSDAQEDQSDNDSAGSLFRDSSSPQPAIYVDAEDGAAQVSIDLTADESPDKSGHERTPTAPANSSAGTATVPKTKTNLFIKRARPQFKPRPVPKAPTIATAQSSLSAPPPKVIPTGPRNLPPTATIKFAQPAFPAPTMNISTQPAKNALPKPATAQAPARVANPPPSKYVTFSLILPEWHSNIPGLAAAPVRISVPEMTTPISDKTLTAFLAPVPNGGGEQRMMMNKKLPSTVAQQMSRAWRFHQYGRVSDPEDSQSDAGKQPDRDLQKLFDDLRDGGGSVAQKWFNDDYLLIIYPAMSQFSLNVNTPPNLRRGELCCALVQLFNTTEPTQSTAPPARPNTSVKTPVATAAHGAGNYQAQRYQGGRSPVAVGAGSPFAQEHGSRSPVAYSPRATQNQQQTNTAGFGTLLPAGMTAQLPQPHDRYRSRLALLGFPDTFLPSVRGKKIAILSDAFEPELKQDCIGAGGTVVGFLPGSQMDLVLVDSIHIDTLKTVVGMREQALKGTEFWAFRSDIDPNQPPRTPWRIFRVSGGIATFSPWLILKEPELFRELLEKFRLSLGWTGYIIPKAVKCVAEYLINNQTSRINTVTKPASVQSNVETMLDVVAITVGKLDGPTPSSTATGLALDLALAQGWQDKALICHAYKFPESEVIRNMLTGAYVSTFMTAEAELAQIQDLTSRIEDIDSEDCSFRRLVYVGVGCSVLENFKDRPALAPFLRPEIEWMKVEDFITALDVRVRWDRAVGNENGW